MAMVVLFCYFSILFILCLYGGHRLYITRLYRKNAENVSGPSSFFDELPMVTVQLPVFNEKFVVERLIDACAAIDYPKDRLQIQVLDDSTDETCAIAKNRVAHYKKKGLLIDYIHRESRVGFKAGALEHGLASAKGRFIAIFDADFIPQPDILKSTIHYLADPRVGMVQARWDHLNREFSTLTQVQAIMLDAHFIIEHGGRCYSDLFFNFNGTAGIWRLDAIRDAGGWQHDTLTEDLDLSYRAQLKGWRFLFLPQVACPAELPTDVISFKSQQHRWAKGAIQVMLKLMPTILRSKIPLKVKIESIFHLSGNLAYILMVINSIFFVIPSMIYREGQPWWQILFIDGPLFGLLSASFIYFYLTSQAAIFKTTKGRKRFIPAIMAVGIGMGVNNTRAAVEALFGHHSEFVRTPKLGVSGEPSDVSLNQNKKHAYQLPKSGWGYLELLLGFMYTCSILWSIYRGNWVSIPFLVLFQNGFYFVGWMTVKEEWSQRVHQRRLAKRDLKAA